MEGIVDHYFKQRNELQNRLRAVEEQLAEANLKVLRLTGEVHTLKSSNDLLTKEMESVQKMSNNWRTDNERLREDLKLQRDDNQLLRDKVKGLEQERRLMAVRSE